METDEDHGWSWEALSPEGQRVARAHMEDVAEAAVRDGWEGSGAEWAELSEAERFQALVGLAQMLAGTELRPIYRAEHRSLLPSDLCVPYDQVGRVSSEALYEASDRLMLWRGYWAGDGYVVMDQAEWVPRLSALPCVDRVEREGRNEVRFLLKNREDGGSVGGLDPSIWTEVLGYWAQIYSWLAQGTGGTRLLCQNRAFLETVLQPLGYPCHWDPTTEMVKLTL